MVLGFRGFSIPCQKMTSRANLRGTDPKKVSGELFALTYGALVAQILKVSQSLFYFVNIKYSMVMNVKMFLI